MTSTKRAGPSGDFTIDVGSVLAEDPNVRAFLERRAKFLECLSPEERAREEARLAAEEEAAERRCIEEERAYEAALRRAENELSEQHEEIKRDRKAGVLGTLTEIGRVYGLSAIRVGQILDSSGLRELVDVHVPWDHPNCDNSLPLRLMRGVADGFAVFDRFDGRTYWIARNVAPLLSAHAVSSGARREKK